MSTNKSGLINQCQLCAILAEFGILPSKTPLEFVYLFKRFPDLPQPVYRTNRANYWVKDTVAAWASNKTGKARVQEIKLTLAQRFQALFTGVVHAEV